MLDLILSWRSVADMAWLIFLLVMLRHFWLERWVLQEAHYWLLTTGQVTRLEWTQEGHQLWPKIEYTYQVNDRDFLGEYFFLDTAHNNPNSKYARKVAYRAAVAYQKGEAISVYYNPENPQQSALDVHIPYKLNVIIGLLIVLIVSHLGIIAYRLAV